jgi:hypothetical protein
MRGMEKITPRQFWLGFTRNILIAGAVAGVVVIAIGLFARPHEGDRIPKAELERRQAEHEAEMTRIKAREAEVLKRAQERADKPIE